MQILFSSIPGGAGVEMEVEVQADGEVARTGGRGQDDLAYKRFFFSQEKGLTVTEHALCQALHACKRKCE